MRSQWKCLREMFLRLTVSGALPCLPLLLSLTVTIPEPFSGCSQTRYSVAAVLTTWMQGCFLDFLPCFLVHCKSRKETKAAVFCLKILLHLNKFSVAEVTFSVAFSLINYSLVTGSELNFHNGMTVAFLFKMSTQFTFKYIY